MAYFHSMAYVAADHSRYTKKITDVIQTTKAPIITPMYIPAIFRETRPKCLSSIRTICKINPYNVIPPREEFLPRQVFVALALCFITFFNFNAKISKWIAQRLKRGA